MAATKTSRIPTAPQWTLGERLAKARRDAGYSQQEMAPMMRVSASTIAKWETDEREPRRFSERVREWARITNVPVGWLLDLTSEISKGPLSLADGRRHLNVIAGGGQITPNQPPIVQVAHTSAD